MAISRHYYIRKAHRWLGVILGIQFLFWTVGGLYFSWSNMDEVHGDFQKKDTPLLTSDLPLISPAAILDTLRSQYRLDSVVALQLVAVLGKPFYQVRGITAAQSIGHDHNKSHQPTNNFLADAVTGQLRGPLSQSEAVSVAASHFTGAPEVSRVEYLTAVSKHHEYRDNPLPAYAITFNHPSGTTVYVASELGTVQKFRNSKWRVFDFLWMMHTMDYQQRDNTSNTVLRICSIFGLVTVLSGFLLFVVSIKRKRKQLSSSLPV